MSSPFAKQLTSPALIGVAIVIVVVAVLFTDVISTGAIGFGREGKDVVRQRTRKNHCFTGFICCFTSSYKNHDSSCWNVSDFVRR